MAYHVLLQWIFLTQGSNPHLLHWQEGSLPLTAPAKPQSTEVRAKAGARNQFWAEISVQSLTSQGTSRYFLTETVPGFSICKMGIIRVPAGRLVVVSTKHLERCLVARVQTASTMNSYRSTCQPPGALLGQPHLIPLPLRIRSAGCCCCKRQTATVTQEVPQPALLETIRSYKVPRGGWHFIRLSS